MMIHVLIHLKINQFYVIIHCAIKEMWSGVGQLELSTLK